MKITDTEINKRIITARISDEEFKSLLVGAVVAETGVNPNHINKIETTISKTEDFRRETQVDVTLTINNPRKEDENGK